MMTSNEKLVRGASDFRDEGSYPLAATAESVASLLWVRSPALAPDVPREMVLATAFVGMQPTAALWGKYIAEVEAVEKVGRVSPDDAIILRSTRVGRDALMAESLGDADMVGEELPMAVLDRVRGIISDPLLVEAGALEAQLAQTEAVANRATEDWLQQVTAREEAERSVQESNSQAAELRARLQKLEDDENAKRQRIQNRSRLIAKRWVRAIAWSVRTLAVLAAGVAILILVLSPDPAAGQPALIVGIIGVLSSAALFLPPYAVYFVEQKIGSPAGSDGQGSAALVTTPRASLVVSRTV